MTKSLQPAGEAPAEKLSFFDIERAWLELIEARQEAEDLPAEERGPAILACDEAIGQYIAREVEKVDGLRHVYFAAAATMTAAKQERDRQSGRIKFAEAIMDRIKSGCQTVMEMTQKKRINGRNGYLLLKGNGGIQPLDIYDPAMVPDAYKLVSVTMPMTLWTSLLRVCRPDVRSRIVPPLVVEQVSVDGTAVREALKEPCPTCGGPDGGEEESGVGQTVCVACGGSGFSAVPGARLLERGQHVEVK